MLRRLETVPSTFLFSTAGETKWQAVRRRTSFRICLTSFLTNHGPSLEPARISAVSRQNTSQAFLMHRFRLSGPLVDYFNEAVLGSCAFCRGFVLFAAGAFLVGGLLTLLVRCSCFWSFLPAACLADTGFTCAVLG